MKNLMFLVVLAWLVFLAMPDLSEAQAQLNRPTIVCCPGCNCDPAVFSEGRAVTWATAPIRVVGRSMAAVGTRTVFYQKWRYRAYQSPIGTVPAVQCVEVNEQEASKVPVAQGEQGVIHSAKRE